MNQLFPHPAGIDGLQTLFSGCALQEKIQLETGNLIRTMNLISVPTLGPTLALQINYNSLNIDSNLGIGYGWTHNWAASITPSSTAPVYTDHSGRAFTFTDLSGEWVQDLDEGVFDRITLTSLPGDEWQISYYPDGNILQFDDTGRLLRVLDTLGNSLEASYTMGGQLEEIEENAVGVSVGRKIQFSYAGDVITVTDPASNEWVLTLDDDNLVSVEGPEGCVTLFEYEDPSDHLITRRVDPVVRDPQEVGLVDQAWLYTFDATGRLMTVTDSRELTLSYAYSDDPSYYSSYAESLGSYAERFRRTVLTDADGQEWKYVFDLTGNLRRVIDPNDHHRRFFWSPQSQLLYEASGNLQADASTYSTYAYGYYYFGPRDSPNSRFRRYVYDVRGNMRLAIDGNGLMTQYEYVNDRLVSVTPGRANFSVQGEWQGHYGKDGYVICAGGPALTDVAELPGYISALVKGTGDVQPISPHVNNHFWLEDSRTVRYPSDNALVKSDGCWRSTMDGSYQPYHRFQFTLEMASETNFNLSLYTANTEAADSSVNYTEQSGFDVEMLVTDSVGTQSFRIPNNAAGCWATFPVRSGEGDVLVEIRARGNNASIPGEPGFDPAVKGDTVLSAIAFDAYESRTTRMAYNEAGQLTLVVDGQGNTWTKIYDEFDGTLVSSLEPGQEDPTLYFYEDDYKNLTGVEDPLAGTTLFTYDLNGNVESVTDADSHTTEFTLDGRNRVIQVHDAAGNDSFRTYDAGGRLVLSQDQEGRETRFAYKHQRLWKITDALGQNTVMDYANSGQVAAVTDARSKTTAFRYDDAQRLVETEYADGAKLRYALDTLSRVTGVTSPNGNQDDLDAIVLEGAKNALFNPSGQESRPYEPDGLTDPDGAVAPRYWNPNTSAAREVDSDGRAYLPINSTVTSWEQNNRPVSAGCRYLASFQARKEDNTSGATEVRMEFAYRVHKDHPYPTPHQIFSSTVAGEDYEPTTQDWEDSSRSRLDVPADVQASLHRPALGFARIKLASGSAPLGVRQLQLQRLSTCFEFDGENLREVCFPDGARQRTEYDRLGRAFLTRDPDGRTILREFDSLDRVVHVVDSLGNELFFQYDDKMDLVLFRLRSQGVDQDTEFAWDALHRLKSITYPDATTELFDYSPGGDLVRYEDNLSQERIYHYDELHRLDLIIYPDITTVALSYDKVGNLLSTVERDSNGWTYSYDDLNRLIGQQYTNQVLLESQYNEVGQRMALSADSAIYGLSKFGEATYGGGEVVWSVPTGGRDDVGRLLVVEDVNGDATEMSYDIDGRCTRIDHENGLSDLMSFDIVGKLLSKVVEGSGSLMEMRYGYSLAGDRIAQQTDLDTFTYLSDAAGRLVEESHNRFCIDQPNVWKQGQWEFLDFDEGTRSLQLTSLNDDFSGTELNLQRWTLESRQISQSNVHGELDAVGVELRQNEGLQLAYPRAFSNQCLFHRAPVDNSIGVDGRLNAHPGMGYPEALYPKPLWLDLRHCHQLVGDFDIAVDYQNFYAWGGYMELQLAVSPTTLTPDSSETWFALRTVRYFGGGSYAQFTKADPSYTGSTPPGFQDTGVYYNPPTEGEIRLKRTGSTYEAFYRAQGGSTWTSMSTMSGPTDDVYIYLSYTVRSAGGSLRVTNFRLLTGDTRASEGVFYSGIYDAGRVVSWDRLSWVEDLPVGCDVELEVCVADDYAEFENYASPPAWFGPTGGGNFTTPAGESLPSGKTGRYAMVRATLTGNGTDSPTLSDIQLTCNSASDTGSRVIRTQYDEAGNILRITTIDDLGVSEDVRDDDGWSSGDRINTLNQIMRQDVGGDTWTFSYDDNGNMTGKTNGVDTWTYSWNDENRLVRVQGPGSVDIAYQYDYYGRMVSRDDGTDVTSFQWDGWQMIRETTGLSTTTYCIPEGQLSSFIHDGERYDCHVDAVGSIRMVSDDSGDVVARMEFDAFGNLLASSDDSVPGGMPYGFVGALGVRTDAATGLLYMRKRWYSPSLQRFISRDPIGLKGAVNLYAYVANSPVTFIDPNGLNTIAAGSIIVGGIEIAISVGMLPTEVAAGAAAAVVFAPIGIVGISIADGMFPVPGGNGTPYFPDTMGEDRMGRRQYEARSESNESEMDEPAQPRPDLSRGGQAPGQSGRSIPRPGPDSPRPSHEDPPYEEPKPCKPYKKPPSCDSLYGQCVVILSRTGATRYVKLCEKWWKECKQNRGPWADPNRDYSPN